MPKDISSSSSEDEADSPATETQTKQKETEKKISKYECPADFVPFSHTPCRSTLMEALKKKQNEVWLIKAPSSFDPKCLHGVKVPLSGLQSCKVPTAAGGSQPGTDQQIYKILASSHCTSDLRLLTRNDSSSHGMVFSQTFSGLLNVCESFGDRSMNQDPQVIPAAPAPSIPTGLKQRFHPFGSRTPTLTCVAENEADGATFGPSSTTLIPLVAKRFVEEAGHEEEGRRKKKKKKEKRLKMERGEEDDVVVRVKQEPVSRIQDEVKMEIPLEENDVLEEEKRKKKKKKKYREREDVEEATEPIVTVKTEDVTVKYEPMDTSYGDVVENSGKKKKKKKKSRTEDD
ncbi:CD3e molecule, epsilon associated protein [Betta splendens]|uniref:CD3e molecule, epsilon associated protein n=1 Tax=Betta splendens TaxID=158456 RepID=A0A6P7PBZ9_BETSP|nr:CD3e molecule, epsilon associated protein [Betta splendens]